MIYWTTKIKSNKALSSLLDFITIGFETLKKETISNVLMLTLGLVGYYFEYYILTFYFIVHFFILIAKYMSKDFEEKLNNFKKDQIIIKNNYLKDFKFFYWLVLIIKLITFTVYYFFSLTAKTMSNFSDLFYIITYIFIIVGFINLGITVYRILFKNNSVVEVAINLCFHCAMKVGYMFIALHVSSNIPSITPNSVSNWYHKHTFLGRGFGARSSGQLLQVDSIKTHLGSEFKYTEKLWMLIKCWILGKLNATRKVTILL
jgi:hypothetical protein